MRAWILAAWVGMVCQALPAEAQLGAPVTGQTASAGSAGVFVLWDGTEDDPQHLIEATDLGGFTLLGSLSAGGPVIASMPLPWPPSTPRPPAFLVPNVPPGTYHVVVVKGLTSSTAGVPHSAWQQVVVPTACTTPPGAPGTLTAVQEMTNNVAVNWQPAGGCPATSYELHAGYQPGLSNAGIFQFPSPGYYGPAPPNTYYLRVRARNAYGVSAFSPEIEFVVEATACIGPGVPHGLTATVNGNLVRLDWQPPVDPGSRPIAQYGVVAGSAPGLTNLGGATVPGSPTSFEATVPNGTYFVRVRANNGCGGSFAWGPPSGEVTVVVPH
ncbi:MAG: hypothetical protein IT177_03555 [Acidobacteria bacterium]|nr:hypothetical protein [Acidobacteriota bacterium]